MFIFINLLCLPYIKNVISSWNTYRGSSKFNRNFEPTNFCKDIGCISDEAICALIIKLFNF